MRVMDSQKSWAMHSWGLKGDLQLSLLGGPPILFEFETISQAERVWHLGPILFERRKLQLDWWRPDVGFFREAICISEVWVRVLGSPVHLWEKEIC